MWTLSIWAFVVTLMLLVLTYALHRWFGIPRERLVSLRDSLMSRAWEWIKARWDFAVAAFMVVAPLVWSAGLDFIVIVANLSAGILPAVAGLDLSSLMISDKVRTGIQLAAIVLPPLRDAFEKVRG